MQKPQNRKNKLRLDDFLVSEGYFETKSQAQGAIMSGDVKVNNEVITKAGTQVSQGIELELKQMRYVSRGAFKLEKAVKSFNIDLTDKMCLDIGASTGGFTDFMLQNSAQKVYAIDVGYGQLAWKLRSDPRVVVIERTNARNVSIEAIYAETTEKASFAAVDVSFISVTKILNNLKLLMDNEKQELILLIKPQFEAGKALVPKSGVIKDKNVHTEVIENVVNCAQELNLIPINLTYSPIKGPAGNIEYLVHLTNSPACGKIDKNIITEIVNQAHENL